MTSTPTLLEMLRAGLHFGHRASKWHPKMKPFIFGERSVIHILNLEKTSEAIDAALAFVRELSSKNGVILFVGTKPQAQEIVKREATGALMPYVTERWLGGTLTNFRVIYDLIKRFLELKRQRDAGELVKYTKYEQLKISEEIGEMEHKVGGISSLTRLPDAIFILDLKHEKTAFREAQAVKMPIVAICDSNVNPDGVAYPIPGNDDAVSAIEMVVGLIAGAVKQGKQEDTIASEAKQSQSV